MEQYKKEAKRGSFKKSMSLSGGMGYNTIPNRDTMPGANPAPIRPPVQSVFRKSMWGEYERERRSEGEGRRVELVRLIEVNK